MYYGESHCGGEEDAGSEKGYSIGLTIQSLKLFDLSHSGRQHPNVVWKNIPELAPKVPIPTLTSADIRTSAPAPLTVSTPMISLNLTLPGSRVKRPPVCPVKFSHENTPYLPLQNFFNFNFSLSCSRLAVLSLFNERSILVWFIGPSKFSFR